MACARLLQVADTDLINSIRKTLALARSIVGHRLNARNECVVPPAGQTVRNINLRKGTIIMKPIARLIAVAALVAASPAALAADAHHPDEGKKPVLPAKPAAKVPPGPAAGDRASMQDRMKRMQEQMDRIQKTTDPKERQKLLDEHQLTMMENMKTMRGMGGPMMMGMHGDATGGAMKGDPAARSDQMEQRMDMMQMMMEHMMQREQMRAPTK